MSYKETGDGNGKLYIGRVKWDNDFNSGNYSAMLFDSESARDKFFMDNFRLIKSNLIYQSPDTYIDVKERIEGIDDYNYIFFTNDSDISNQKYCCFLNNYEYIAPNTTRLYLELDVFQMLMYKTTFYQSYIERATVKRSADTVGAYVQGEPFSVNLVYEQKIKDILESSDWDPQWVLHSTSKFVDAPGYADRYEYEGTGTGNTFGEYGFYINSKAELKKYIETYGRKGFDEILEDTSISIDWKGLLNQLLSGGTAVGQEGIALNFGASLAELQDHRNELIGLYAIPKWAKSSGKEATNTRVEKSESITLNDASLGNGYMPRNKKLLTSVCRAYVLLNQNGLQVALKPELFTRNTSVITVSGIPMSTTGYQYKISNYDDYSASFGEVPYNSDRRVGYDQNTGLNKILNTVGAVSNLAGAAANLAGGNYVQGAGELIQSGITAVDQIGSKGAYFGNNGDLLRVTDGRAQLRFFEMNPSVNECNAIDDYFDMYGYTINEIFNINNKDRAVYIRGRSNWNFVKVRKLNARCYAPMDWERKFKSIFESGVTLWHSYEHFADYSQKNN